MKNPYLRWKNRSPVNDVRSGTADRFYQTARLAVPILINGFPFPGKPVPMITICKEAMKRLWNHQAMRKKTGKGRLFSWGEEERREKKEIWQIICQDRAEFAESCALTQGVGAERLLHHK